MNIPTDITADGCSGRRWSYNVVIMLAALLVMWSPTLVVGDIGMLVFPLTQIATTTVNDYAVQIRLGTTDDSQSIQVLPAFYAAEIYDAKIGGSKPLYVPSAQLCLYQKQQAEWNKFLSPVEGEIINTYDRNGTYEVEWAPSVFTKEVNLTLREGSGDEGKNITDIERMYSVIF